MFIRTLLMDVLAFFSSMKIAPSFSALKLEKGYLKLCHTLSAVFILFNS